MQDTSNSDLILKISSVKRDHGKAFLTLSNGEVLAMPRAMLKERPYRSGMPFDLQAFQAFLQERSYPYAMDKAVTLLSLRARTEKEIVDALKKNAYPSHAIARVMERINDAGYINDKDFAFQYSAARLSRGMGAQRIRMELRRKGVESETIDETIDALDQDDVDQSAISMAKKAARGKNLGDRADRQKVLAALARRGYDFSTARRALEAIEHEER